jgi:hypothetical protein
MPIQIDNVEVISTPPAEPAQPAATPAPTADLADRLRAWQHAATCRSDRLRAD